MEKSGKKKSNLDLGAKIGTQKPAEIAGKERSRVKAEEEKKNRSNLGPGAKVDKQRPTEISKTE